MPSRMLVVSALLATTVWAGGRKESRPPVAPPTAAPASPRKAPVVITDVGAALQQVETLYKTLEYDQVIPLADALLAREDLSQDQRLEVYRLQGSSRAIVEDPIEAERPFRLLLRARADYELPPDTPPKIMAVFRKVQSEEKALATQLRGVERARLVGNLRLLGEPTKDPVGGRPIRFAYRLRDTAGVVESVRVEYRRAGQKAYSSLVLERSDDGEWRGLIPGEFTADDAGFKLEYLVETSDREGPLLVLGTETTPQTLTVAPGRVVQPAFKPISREVFFVSLSATAAAGIATGVLGVLFNTTQTSYSTIASGMTTTAQLQPLRERGETFALGTNVLLITTGVTLVATLILLPLTRFFEE